MLKKDRSSSWSPKSSNTTTTTMDHSDTISTTPKTKKSTITRRRASVEELEKACDANPSLRDAITANLGKNTGGIRLGNYRTTTKSYGTGDEFTKSFEEWGEHNNDSSESTTTTAQSETKVQPYETTTNPLSKFIGKQSSKANANKDDNNTVSTGSGASTKSKTRMIPVVKAPAGKSSQKSSDTQEITATTRVKHDATKESWLKSTGERKNQSITSAATIPPTLDEKCGNELVDTSSISSIRRLVGPVRDQNADACTLKLRQNNRDSITSRTSNTTESTVSSKENENDIPMHHCTSFFTYDSYPADQIFPEFAERFAKPNGLKRKESVRVATTGDPGTARNNPSTDRTFYGHNNAYNTKGNTVFEEMDVKSQSIKSVLAPKLPQRRRSTRET
jgi:hypothetical protein